MHDVLGPLPDILTVALFYVVRNRLLEKATIRYTEHVSLILSSEMPPWCPQLPLHFIATTSCCDLVFCFHSGAGTLLERLGNRVASIGMGVALDNRGCCDHDHRRQRGRSSRSPKGEKAGTRGFMVREDGGFDWTAAFHQRHVNKGWYPGGEFAGGCLVFKLPIRTRFSSHLPKHV